MKRAFETSFVREETEFNKNKETAAKTWKKKSKNDKESTEKTDFSTEQEHMSKRTVSSAEDHHDNSESRDQIFKKQKCQACSEFHFYKKCYYLFLNLVSEDWMTRSEIKKVVRETLENEDFAEKVKKLQNMKKKDWLLLRSIEKIESVFFVNFLQIIFSIKFFYSLRNLIIFDSDFIIHVFNEIIWFLNFWSAQSDNFLWISDHKISIQSYSNIDMRFKVQLIGN